MSRPGLAAIAALALLAAPVGAQTERTARPVLFELPVTDAVAPTVPARRRARVPECVPATEGALFEVTYTGFPAGAEAAFQAAVDTWACRIRSDQPIRVDATWASLNATTLGSAGPFLYRNFPRAPTRDVWYPAALADALSGRDLGDGSADIEATFNSDFSDWHIGVDPAPAGLYDLYTVVLHELGHGLGIIGSLKVEGGVGRVGTEPEGPFSYDLHTQTPAGVSLLDADVFPDRSRALADALQGEVRFSGTAVGQTTGGTVPLYAPDMFVTGGSYSHLDELAFPANTGDGLMTPFVARGESIAIPGPVVCAILADVGWTLAGDCAARVGPLPTGGPTITATVRGANPVRGRTVVTLASTDAVSVRITLVDVLGRRVATLGSAVLVGGATLDVAVEAGGLASGVYFVRVVGGSERLAVPLVVVR